MTHGLKSMHTLKYHSIDKPSRTGLILRKRKAAVVYLFPPVSPSSGPRRPRTRSLGRLEPGKPFAAATRAEAVRWDWYFGRCRPHEAVDGMFPAGRDGDGDLHEGAVMAETADTVELYRRGGKRPSEDVSGDESARGSKN